MTSTSGSNEHSPVETAAVVAHGRVNVRDAVERVRAVAEGAGVQLVDDPADAQLAVAVGGDGTILRTLARLLGTGTPVIGINFGRVGFLASISPERLEDDLVRIFAGEYRTIAQPTLEAQLDGKTFVAAHSLDARPLVVPRGAELTVRNATPDVGAAVLADGHRSGELAPERMLSIRLGEQRSLLATLPETTFFGRYRETFTS